MENRNWNGTGGLNGGATVNFLPWLLGGASPNRNSLAGLIAALGLPERDDDMSPESVWGRPRERWEDRPPKKPQWPDPEPRSPIVPFGGGRDVDPGFALPPPGSERDVDPYFGTGPDGGGWDVEPGIGRSFPGDEPGLAPRRPVPPPRRRGFGGDDGGPSITAYLDKDQLWDLSKRASGRELMRLLADARPGRYSYRTQNGMVTDFGPADGYDDGRAIARYRWPIGGDRDDYIIRYDRPSGGGWDDLVARYDRPTGGDWDNAIAWNDAPWGAGRYPASGDTMERSMGQLLAADSSPSAPSTGGGTSEGGGMERNPGNDPRQPEIRNPPRVSRDIEPRSPAADAIDDVVRIAKGLGNIAADTVQGREIQDAIAAISRMAGKFYGIIGMLDAPGFTSPKVLDDPEYREPMVRELWSDPPRTRVRPGSGKEPPQAELWSDPPRTRGVLPGSGRNGTPIVPWFDSLRNWPTPGNSGANK
jgi:hypothetical protein